MGESQCFTMTVDLLKLHISSWVVGNVVEDHHQFSQEIVDFDGRLKLRRDENFDRSILLEYAVEFVADGLVIVINELLTCFLLVLDSDRLLSLFGRQLLPFLPLFHL